MIARDAAVGWTSAAAMGVKAGAVDRGQNSETPALDCSTGRQRYLIDHFAATAVADRSHLQREFAILLLR
jgi:hypothetical protein